MLRSSVQIWSKALLRLRPYPGENTASRSISHSQAPESLVSIVVGDHTRILGAAIFLPTSVVIGLFLPCVLAHVFLPCVLFLIFFLYIFIFLYFYIFIILIFVLGHMFRALCQLSRSTLALTKWCAMRRQTVETGPNYIHLPLPELLGLPQFITKPYQVLS
jgi:hypothetical protein